ncbi:MAG: adenylate/guanylate cyclase domain-containing protein [Gammaproteobacteria bacterium]|nr:adenylate/guanylate cyclase domain-containing protein [Gammaproteobacteria bacterium]
MESERLPRKLAAILYADVVGYSRLMGADESGTLARLKAHRKELIDPSIASHRGRMVKLMGDGALIEFASVVDALACAVDIQRGMVERNQNESSAQRIEFRMGINLGDVMIEGDDIYGDGVNVAARLEGLADPGGICISESVRSAVGNKLSFDYEFMGEQQVKNIAEPIRTYRVAVDSSKAQATSSETVSLELPDKPSIAVLPFTNMSGDPEQEYFSDGVTEDIITSLSNFSGLFVIARNSSFSYKGEAVDVKQVARELGVRYVLEGSIQRAGNRIRINAQLIDAVGGHHLWAERYDRDLEDIFEVQDEITRNIVGSIAPQIELAEVERGRRLPSANLTAYELSLKAQALFYDGARSGNPKFLEEAIVAAQAALDIDPRSTHALWTQAFAYVYQYLYRWSPDPAAVLARSWDVSERLIQVDSLNPKAYMSRAVVHQFRGDFDAAIADYRRAFTLNPNFAMNLVVMAWGESLAGLTKEAREHAELGLRLSPRDMEMWLGEAYLALLQASFAEGDFEEAKRFGVLAIQMGPKAPIRRALMIACCAYTGDSQGAVRHAQELNAFAPDFIPSVLSGAMTLYKMPEHNALLVDGLRKAGLPE